MCMKLNSLNLEAFHAAARLGHFTKASAHLNITQSALSQRIGKLEEELETTLFVRDKKQVRLTDSGNELLRYCQINAAIENEMLEKLKTSRDHYAGHLVLGCFSSVGRSLLVPSLAPLLKKNPQLSLSILNKEMDELAISLSQSECDYILTTKPLERNGIEKIFLGFEVNTLVQEKNSKSNKVYLDHDRNDNTTESFFKFNSLKYECLNQHFLDDVYGLIDGVKQGLGQAVLPLHLIANEKNLVPVYKKKYLKVPVYLQYYKQPFYRSIHEDVVAAIENHFLKHLN